MGEWFTDEAFWRDVGPFVFSAQRLEGADVEAEQALALAGYSGGAILDLCCGVGRHAVALARGGRAVTGVDATRSLLEQAEQRAQQANVHVEWRLADARVFSRPEGFGLALNLFTSLGYFESRDEDLEVMRRTCENLRAGGAFIIDIMGREVLARDFKPAIAVRLADGSLLVHLNEIQDDWTRVRSEWIRIEGGQARSYEVRLHVYSGQELKNALARAGFAEVALFGSLDGVPYDQAASRLVAVARKGAAGSAATGSSGPAGS